MDGSFFELKELYAFDEKNITVTVIAFGIDKMKLRF